MNNIYMIFLPFIAFLVWASFFDLLTFTIPNWLCALLAASFFPAAMAAHLPLAALAEQIACGLTILAATFLLFQFGWLGGGDAKLAAAIALWLGWKGLPLFILQTGLWGGALAALLLLLRQLPLPLMIINQRYVARLRDPQEGAPYGIALTFGGILALSHSALWALVGGA
jgi:prepilin peptidase CpaA